MDKTVQKFWDRTDEAIAEAKARYGRYCLSIARNVLCDRRDAEECLNDVLLAAWNSIPPQKPENLKTYLGKLTREKAIDRLRHDTRKKRVPSAVVQSLDEMAEIVSSGEFADHLEEHELAREISRFLLSVDETKRNVFVRRYWYYDSVDAICRRYGFGKSKVAMMLKRTRDDLARHLKKEGFLT